MSDSEKIESLLKQNEVIVKSFTEIMLRISALEIALIDSGLVSKEKLQESLEKYGSKLIEVMQDIAKQNK
jgi:hypothetical protein